MLLSQLPVGALVKDTGTAYNGDVIIWEVLEHGHTDDPTNSTTLASRDIITVKCFDAKEPNNSDTKRQQYGNNRYLYSNILQWLNSNSADWYVAQHSADAPPNSTNVWQSSGTAINPYESEAGFLTNFSAKLRDALMTVSKTTAKNTVTDGGSYETVSSKMFLLSTTEVGLANENSIAEGSVYAFYSGSNNTNDRRKKNLANDAAKGNYSSATSPWYWWLRTPHSGYSNFVRFVFTDGTLNYNNAYYGNHGVVPALCLSSSAIKVTDTTDSDGAYTIVWNTAPTITVDSQSLGNKDKAFDVDFTISDADSDTVTYQIKLDTRQIETGTATLDVEQSVTITSSMLDVLPYGLHTITIIADDGTVSSSVEITFSLISPNLRILGSSGDLGEISSYTYTIDSKFARKRIIPFSVNKANGSITLSKDSITLSREQLSDTVTVITNAGTISATSSDTSICIVSVSNNVVTVTSAGTTNGSATVTIITTGSDNYNPATTTLSVMATCEVVKKTFSAATDEEIAEMVAAADEGLIDLYEDCGWRVGQERTVSLSSIASSGTYDGVSWSVGESQSAQTATLVLMHRGSYSLVNPVKYKNGSTRTVCSFVVGLKNSLSTYGYMNSTNTNSGSWNGSARRNWCNSGFRQAIPSTIRGCFKQFKTVTAQTYNGSTKQTSNDYFALPAAKEIFGGTASSAGSETSYSNLTEFNALTQFTYYQTSANRVKKQGDSGSAYGWWERSPRYDSPYGFCFVASDGSVNNTVASYTIGLSPFGCI